MKKTATHIYETKENILKIYENNQKIKKYEDEYTEAFEKLFFDIKELKITEKKKASKILREGKLKNIEALKLENELLTLATNFMADDIRNNLFIGTYKALKEFKLIEKNLTELRKDKIKKYLIDNNYISSENNISVYRDTWGYIKVNITIKGFYTTGIELFFDDSNADYIETKRELKEVKNIDYYNNLAKKYIDTVQELKKEVSAFNNNIKDKITALNTEITYGSDYIYNEAVIDLYK